MSRSIEMTLTNKSSVKTIELRFQVVSMLLGQLNCKKDGPSRVANEQ